MPCHKNTVSFRCPKGKYFTFVREPATTNGTGAGAVNVPLLFSPDARFNVPGVYLFHAWGQQAITVGPPPTYPNIGRIRVHYDIDLYDLLPFNLQNVYQNPAPARALVMNLGAEPANLLSGFYDPSHPVVTNGLAVARSNDFVGSGVTSFTPLGNYAVPLYNTFSTFSTGVVKVFNDGTASSYKANNTILFPVSARTAMASSAYSLNSAELSPAEIVLGIGIVTDIIEIILDYFGPAQIYGTNVIEEGGVLRVTHNTQSTAGVTPWKPSAGAELPTLDQSHSLFIPINANLITACFVGDNRNTHCIEDTAIYSPQTWAGNSVTEGLTDSYGNCVQSQRIKLTLKQKDPSLEYGIRIPSCTGANWFNGNPTDSVPARLNFCGPSYGVSYANGGLGNHCQIFATDVLVPPTEITAPPGVALPRAAPCVRLGQNIANLQYRLAPGTRAEGPLVALANLDAAPPWTPEPNTSESAALNDYLEEVVNAISVEITPKVLSLSYKLFATVPNARF
jgi:hypothetical protein